MKHIVYKYDDDHSDEMEFDARGSLILDRGDIVSRHGRVGKLSRSNTRTKTTANSFLPIGYI